MAHVKEMHVVVEVADRSCLLLGSAAEESYGVQKLARTSACVVQRCFFRGFWRPSRRAARMFLAGCKQ